MTHKVSTLTTSMQASEPVVKALSGFVQLGLLEFWQRALPGDSGVISLLKGSIKELLGTRTIPDWKYACRDLQKIIKTATPSAPLARLYHDYELSMAQLFTLGLTGEVESSHIVNLAIAELQKPDKHPRPGLHLIAAILEELFADPHMAVFDIAQQRLVQEQVLHMEGEGPLPLKRLAIEPVLWSLLCGRQTQWPRCKLMSQSGPLSQWAQNEIDKLVILLTAQDDASSCAGVVIRSNPNGGRRHFSSYLAHALGLKALWVPHDLWCDLPVLAIACRYAGWLPVVQPEISPGEAVKLPECQQHVSLVVLMGTDGAIDADNFIETSIALPEQQQRQQVWNDMLNDESLSRILAGSALLSTSTIQMLATNAKTIARQKGETLQLPHIAEARRKMGVEKLRLLAQPVFREVTAEALVIPKLVEQGLDAVILRARKRESLSQGMGATLKATPNPGVRVLFLGESGTGKTLAASYIATSLAAPLYRVDLSAVMNKYIGESEKNLAQLLDQAAANDVVLLFDEADALFGSRTEGKETGERYANMLTNFLLTRIENHPGIVILTTNSNERIDKAFNRRIDMVIEFPLPGYEESLHLWQSHLGDRGPGEQVSQNLAGHCDLTGGQIRNVVLTAAVYAEDDKISKANLWQGLQEEYNKIGRELTHKLDYLLVPSSQSGRK